MRFTEFLALIFSPRRAAAYRLLEAELQRSRDMLAAREEKIEMLYKYILFQAKQAPLDAVIPKPRTETPRPVNVRPSISEKEAEYQARFQREFERKQREQRQSDMEGLPNEFSSENPFNESVS